MTRIELIAAAEGCTLFNRLKKIGSTPYHICYECSDLDESISDLRSDNFMLIREPQSAVAIDNRRVAFMYSNAIGLIELLECKGEI
ncbi:MAG: VOC family protein [Selenomonadaceae bacterium]|nr:VOC family protein [Selenomonadaceae bacterium]MBR1579276.1 VOC family protein [Selenomonadaceae bacterium]